MAEAAAMASGVALAVELSTSGVTGGASLTAALPTIAASAGLRLTGYAFRSAVRVAEEALAAKAPTSATALTKYWPENNGFLGATTEAFLYKGQKIDRYGGGDWSRFFSPQGTPDFARALPPGAAGQQLRTFEVMKPLPVQSGRVAPAFGQIGGGTQMVSPQNLKTLLDRGILREVTP